MTHLWRHLRSLLLQRQGMPKWRDDKTAQMFGIAQFGCPTCGFGAIRERDEQYG